MAAKKKTSAKKSAAKKSSTKKSPTKKSPTKKAPAKKAAAKGAAKKSSPKKDSPKKDAAAKADASEGSAEKPAAKGFSSLEVNMGQIFALRPRTSTSFRPNDFREARHLLSEESFESAHEAARGVAIKALELTQGGAPTSKKSHSSRRRW